jgi:hypothetical protein
VTIITIIVMQLVASTMSSNMRRTENVVILADEVLGNEIKGPTNGRSCKRCCRGGHGANVQ